MVETLTDHMNTSITSAIRSSEDEALSAHLKPLYDEWETKSADYRTKEEDCTAKLAKAQLLLLPRVYALLSDQCRYGHSPICM